MKRILFLIAVFCLISSQVWAAGACVKTSGNSRGGADVQWAEYTCTGDASNGSIANTTITGFSGYYLYTVETWPGGTAPTDDTDFTLLDATTGEDLMGGNGTDAIDATDSKTLIPKSAAMGLNLFHMVKGNMTLVITNQSVHSGIFYIRITGAK